VELVRLLAEQRDAAPVKDAVPGAELLPPRAEEPVPAVSELMPSQSVSKMSVGGDGEEEVQMEQQEASSSPTEEATAEQVMDAEEDEASVQQVLVQVELPTESMACDAEDEMAEEEATTEAEVEETMTDEAEAILVEEAVAEEATTEAEVEETMTDEAEAAVVEEAVAEEATAEAEVETEAEAGAEVFMSTPDMAQAGLVVASLLPVDLQPSQPSPSQQQVGSLRGSRRRRAVGGSLLKFKCPIESPIELYCRRLRPRARGGWASAAAAR
jgi:hypothetical protein